MCKDYKYVAIGGIVSKEIRKEHYPMLRWFIDKAHEAGAKIHGLGFTVENVERYKFDSVDSTSWSAGNQFGFYYFFKNGTIIKKHPKPGQKIKYSSRDLGEHNFNEWVKYQKWLKTR